MQIRFLGHAAFELQEGETSVLIDPFLTGNPRAAAAAEDLNPDAILLTHGHADHLGDTAAIAKRTGADVVAIVEIANELSGEGVQNVRDPNIGGTVEFDWGWVRLVPAWHTSTTPKGAANVPAGLVIGFGGKVIFTSVTPRCSPTCSSSVAAIGSTSRSCASAVTTRWIVGTPSRPRS